jgi:3-keto-L-gulonate-6-phosphate decarboxylase
MKISDNAEAEVEMVATAGASAVTCLGVASLQTIDKFIKACDLHKLDSMIDLMNVADPLTLFKKLKKIPKVAIIHRGVDETEKTKGKTIPYYQINKLKGAFGAMVAIAGGDDPREVQSAIFNGANIVVVWKNFLKADAGAGMVQAFLKDIK